MLGKRVARLGGRSENEAVLFQTACEMAGVDPEAAQIDLQQGVIKAPEADE